MSISTYKHKGVSSVDLGLELEYRKALKNLATEMTEDILREAAQLWSGKTANDSMNFPKWFIVQMMKRIRAKWYNRFSLLEKDILPLLESRTDKRTQTQIVKALSQYGFTFKFEPTGKEKLYARSFAIENAIATKAIPMAIAAQAQAAIYRAWEKGGDLAGLSSELERIGNYGRDKAELTARDQLSRLTQQMAIANAKEAGVRKARWIHLPGQYSSRKTHIKFNGQTFNLDDGLFDSDVGRLVKPGELKYCACQFRIIPPGFD